MTDSSAVLPICMGSSKERDDLQRAQILLQSLRTFVSDRDRMTIWVVSPDSEVDAVYRGLGWRSSPNVKLEFLPDSALAPVTNDPFTPGWRIQQIIKLAFACICPTEFYLTLDADVIAVRPFSASDLFPRGKALYHAFPASDPQWQRWIRCSAEILGIGAGSSSWTLAATPALFSRSIVLQAQARVQRRTGQPWAEYLLQASSEIQWSENQMYHLVARDSLLLDKYHVQSRDIGRYLHRWVGGAWTREEAARWTPSAAFAPTDEPFYFVVCNSYTGISPARVAESVAPYLVEDRPRTAAGATRLAEHRPVSVRTRGRIRRL